MKQDLPVLKDIDKIDFESPKIKREFKALEDWNRKLIASIKIHTQSLHEKFTIKQASATT